MIGFGNPLLDGPQNDPQYGAYFKKQAGLARDNQQCRKTVSQRVAALFGWRGGMKPVETHGGLADIAQIRIQKPLPETADELCAVARDLKADTHELRLGARATEREVKRLNASGQLAQYRIVHFATHGVVNKSVPELSGIILAQDTTGGEDGILHLSEVYNLDLDADLVVLSACQTGTGKVARGEGLMSLTRGFMYAGSDALLASYWQVADGSTNWLMVSFYEYLLNGQSKTTALRNAKLDLMERYPQFAQPYYWASFVLIGK
jgi:CHAT domain-containing protein